MYTEGEFALSQYLPYTLVPFYPLFQERGGPRVERDQSDWEVRQLSDVQLVLFMLICETRMYKPPKLMRRFTSL